MTSSNGNIFRVTGPLCGEFIGHRWIPLKRPVTQSFGVFFDLHRNKRLSKHSRRRWLETPSHSLWRHCNVNGVSPIQCLSHYINQISYRWLIWANLDEDNHNGIQDNARKWKRSLPLLSFYEGNPPVCPFVKGIHQSPVDFPTKDRLCGALLFSLALTLTNC